MPTTSDIAVVSANFGSIDAVQILPRAPGVDAFYYTDEAGYSSASAEAVASWTQVIVPNYPRSDFNNRLRSRYFKHQIHRLNEVKRHRWLVWTDSSLQFMETGFLVAQARRFEALPARQRVLLVPHPERQTILQEYEFIQTQIAADNPYLAARYKAEKMLEQIRDFEQRGWAIDAPLYCGTFWMIENSDLCRRCWDDWWDQNLRFGMMDQLSLAPVLRAHDLVPTTLDLSIWSNSHFNYVPHQTPV